MSASPAPSGSGSGSQRTGTPSNLPAAFQTAPLHAAPPVVAKPKGGIFTSDGSFLERFRKTKEEETEREKTANALAKAKAENDRIKNRGKRKLVRETSASASPAPEEPVAGREPKKAKKVKDEPESEYQRAMRQMDNHSLKDTAIGGRSMVK